MEVQKPKYGSEKKSHPSVSSALLTDNCVCWGLVAKGWFNLRAGSWAWTAASVAITKHVTASECG